MKDPGLWAAPAEGQLVASLLGSNSLAPVHRLALEALATDPTAVPGGSGVSVVPPTTRAPGPGGAGRSGERRRAGRGGRGHGRAPGNGPRPAPGAEAGPGDGRPCGGPLAPRSPGPVGTDLPAAHHRHRRRGCQCIALAHRPGVRRPPVSHHDHHDAPGHIEHHQHQHHDLETGALGVIGIVPG